MNLEQAFANYGPAMVFLGAAFEGNMAVIAGGFLAHQKLMSLWVAFLSAATGSWMVDQWLFMAGRRFRHNSFVQRTCATKAFARSLAFIERYPNSFILTFRFIYGVRLAGPVALGVTSISDERYFVLNLLGAIVWAAFFTLCGFFFGQAIETFFGQFKVAERYIAWAIGAGVAIFALYHLGRRLRGKRLGSD